MQGTDQSLAKVTTNYLEGNVSAQVTQILVKAARWSSLKTVGRKLYLPLVSGQALGRGQVKSILSRKNNFEK